MRIFHFVLAICLSLPIGFAFAAPGYFRFPAVGIDQVVFTAEGDLWSVPLTGGRASRLTSHVAQEIRPAISPDGQWLAFSASYDGPLEVYVMPLAGGSPKRLSFYGRRNFVLGWTAQGEVIFNSQSPMGPDGHRQVNLVNPNTLQQKTLPLANINDAALSADGKTVWFGRLGLTASSGDNARFYQGGLAAHLWRFDGSSEARLLAPGYAGNDRRPMWWQDRLYFISDRDGCDNLWSMQGDGNDLRQHTQHRQFCIRGASLGHGRIAYQLGADLHIYDIAGQSDRLLPIQLVSDFDSARDRLLKRPLDNFESSSFGSNDERVVVVARGRIVIAGTGPQRRVDIPTPAASRARDAVLSPDGKWLYLISDQSGDNQLWRYASDGSDRATQLTFDQAGQRESLTPSPDGRWLAHRSRDGKLWVLNLGSGKNDLIDTADSADHHDVVWSTDSRYLAFTRSASSMQREQLFLFELANRHKEVLTSDRYESGSPAFSPDGRWLYFVSNRHFQPTTRSPWGDRNLGPFFDRRGKIYALALQTGLRFPFLPDDELSASESTPASPDRPLPAVQWAGLAKRLHEVPVSAGNYQQLAHDGKRLYVLEADASGSKKHLKTIAIDNQDVKTELFASDIQDYALSPDRKHLYLRRAASGGAGEQLVVDAGAKLPGDTGHSTLRLSDWTLTISPRQEWRQMFFDAWRMHRDGLFDARLRGVDWQAVRDKYAPLLDRVTERAELQDLLAQMVAEVGTLHSAVYSSDNRSNLDNHSAAYLGAVIEKEVSGYRIKHIYRGEPELPSEYSPLAQAGVDAENGDLIIAINGRSTLGVQDIAELLQNQAGQQILLTLLRGKQQIKTVVTPIDSARHSSLRYSDWEERLRSKVEQAGHGRIGYLHLRAMGGEDMGTFAREFYAQFDRDGLIIDLRNNDGGNIDSWIMEKLLRRAWAFWQPRDGSVAYTNMQQVFRGHLVVLIDELTYSDGETLAAGIKALQLGPLVGKRTAGAGVWLSDKNSLIDGGMARLAETAQFSVKSGEWLVEGIGVSPDIEVDNLPHATYLGRDQQLDRAVEYLQEKLQQHPIPTLRPKAIPPLRHIKPD
ncbi:S41 family peptidase [Parachitinimonas caeni]|uniref:Tricorn protease homolog n=1 Tax=Parachitinimonas caeni TaxID=3031301 RepID=A0ABT7DVH0_9NEIS|nr:S41 family peptidase [Parachitinimonas caeni]MDK2124065.1 S41 family peptidase [Parachitinimonas caeni]